MEKWETFWLFMYIIIFNSHLASFGDLFSSHEQIIFAWIFHFGIQHSDQKFTTEWTNEMKIANTQNIVHA